MHHFSLLKTLPPAPEVDNIISGLEPKCPALLLSSSSCSKNSQNLHKSSQPTLESSSIQTAELIVKCHTILEMGGHDGSAYTFGSSH